MPPKASQQENVVQTLFDPSFAGARFPLAKGKRNFYSRPHFAAHQDLQQNLEAMRLNRDISNTNPPHEKESRHRILNANFRFLQGLGQPNRQSR